MCSISLSLKWKQENQENYAMIFVFAENVFIKHIYFFLLNINCMAVRIKNINKKKMNERESVWMKKYVIPRVAKDYLI